MSGKINSVTCASCWNYILECKQVVDLCYVLTVSKRIQWYCLKSSHAAPFHAHWISVFLSCSTTQRYTVQVAESDVEITVINKWMEYMMNVITCYLCVLPCICWPHSTSTVPQFSRFIPLISSHRHSTLHSLCHPLHTIPLYTVSATPYTPFLLRSPLRSSLLRNKQISERDGQSLEYQRSLFLGLWRKWQPNNLFPIMKQKVTLMSYGAPVATLSVPNTAPLQRRMQFHSNA